MIELRNVTKSYSGKKAVDDISFSVERGEILGFLGPNAAGKTTTMRMITCYMPPTAGTILVEGLDTTENSLEVRKKIGYLPEMAPIYADMNVLDYLHYAGELRRLDATQKRQRIREMIAICGLEEVLGQDIGQLSKGYRQRVGLAQAMIHDPEILVLDEPTAGLDPNQIAEIRTLIKRLGQEKTLILSTHILPEVQATCSRIIIINRGKLVADGKPDELSAGFRGRDIIHAHVKAPREALLAKTRTMTGVEEVREIPTDDGSIGIRLESAAGTDLREGLWRLSVSENWPILELRRERLSLEEVFRALTQEADEATDEKKA
ncbi:MAG: ATP-binding cassette domain-containing protein [Calditrichaeota bacterium]|nr:ATP-binding cassette domain-containing protein [Calditrichota bacterium]